MAKPPINRLVKKPSQNRDKASRRHPRYMFLAAAEVTEVNTGDRFAARTSELSLGGCRMHALREVPAGSVVQIRLCRDDNVLEVTAKVVYSQAGSGTGMAFVQLTAEQLSLLEKWLARLTTPRSPSDRVKS